MEYADRTPSIIGSSAGKAEKGTDFYTSNINLMLSILQGKLKMETLL
jgi:hypothetical protein